MILNVSRKCSPFLADGPVDATAHCTVGSGCNMTLCRVAVQEEAGRAASCQGCPGQALCQSQGQLRMFSVCLPTPVSVASAAILSPATVAVCLLIISPAVTSSVCFVCRSVGAVSWPRSCPGCTQYPDEGDQAQGARHVGKRWRR